jgi:hypothetical protein
MGNFPVFIEGFAIGGVRGLFERGYFGLKCRLVLDDITFIIAADLIWQ